MLPSAKSSLQDGGFSPKAAAWTLVACFLAGAVGIQFLSRILHRYMPSHVVDCDHSHDEEDQPEMTESEHGKQSDEDARRKAMDRQHSQRWRGRPSLKGTRQTSEPLYGTNSSQNDQNGHPPFARRPSLTSRVSKLVTGSKAECDENGQCYGYSEPCGQECFKNITARGGTRLPASSVTRPHGLGRSITAPRSDLLSGERQPLLLPNVDEHAPLTLRDSSALEGGSHTNGDDSGTSTLLKTDDSHALHKTQTSSTAATSQHDGASTHAHHHHVPTNAFLSIGLQTSIAIALHKLPEGFITYATNHANPKLGFAVFLALFIHNITEGFAMALPLYLAINSRWKAVAISSILGGVSQPLGAGVAALWFKLAGNHGSAPGEGVYGVMFAVTGKSSSSPFMTNDPG